MTTTQNHASSLATARATVTAPSEQAADGKKKRDKSNNAKAAKLCDDLDELDSDEQAELAASPASIREKFSKKREALYLDADTDVRAIVDRMRRQ